MFLGAQHEQDCEVLLPETTWMQEQSEEFYLKAGKLYENP